MVHLLDDARTFGNRAPPRIPSRVQRSRAAEILMFELAIEGTLRGTGQDWGRLTHRCMAVQTAPALRAKNAFGMYVENVAVAASA